MSRSRRKTPISGNTPARSDKEDKRLANKKFRQAERQAIYHEKDPPENPKEVADCWDFNKDGKSYFDEEEYPELMRK